jgi:hypothetical protein
MATSSTSNLNDQISVNPGETFEKYHFRVSQLAGKMNSSDTATVLKNLGSLHYKEESGAQKEISSLQKKLEFSKGETSGVKSSLHEVVTNGKNLHVRPTHRKALPASSSAVPASSSAVPASSSSDVKQTCLFFNKKGGCSRGEACTFAHIAIVDSNADN